jgi:ribosomal protein L22
MEKAKQTEKEDKEKKKEKMEEELSQAEAGLKEEKKEEKKEEAKKPKKTSATVRGLDIPISTRHSVAICKFIKSKDVDSAIALLEQVMAHKKALPMKGEIPHRKGEGMMSGRYPEKATGEFIKLLKSLKANADANEIDEPTIAEASANLASMPYGKFGSVRKKRTNVWITARKKPEKEAKKT